MLFPTPRSTADNDDFHQRIKRFVATKADLLFSMEGKQRLQRGVDYGMHLNQEGTLHDQQLMFSHHNKTCHSSR